MTMNCRDDDLAAQVMFKKLKEQHAPTPEVAAEVPAEPSPEEYRRSITSDATCGHCNTPIGQSGAERWFHLRNGLMGCGFDATPALSTTTVAQPDERASLCLCTHLREQHQCLVCTCRKFTSPSISEQAQRIAQELWRCGYLRDPNDRRVDEVAAIIQGEAIKGEA